jgi:hypothetical protein
MSTTWTRPVEDLDVSKYREARNFIRLLAALDAVSSVEHVLFFAIDEVEQHTFLIKYRD